MGLISNVTVLGGGTLGTQIAFHTSYKGLNVVIYDIDFDAFTKTMDLFQMLKNIYTKELNVSSEHIESTLGRISFSTDLGEAVIDADLVIEAVPEDMQIKKQVYMDLSVVAPENTIFTTNSSTFLPSDLMEFTGRPDKFLALHFANALYRFNTAEIMGSPKTDPGIFQTVTDFVNQIGMIPIIFNKEKSGYVLNTLLSPLLAAACELYIKGIADIETIDKTWRIATGSPAGPFEIIDVIGLNTIYNILMQSEDVRYKMFASYLKKNYIKEGKTGYLSGEGFYKY